MNRVLNTIALSFLLLLAAIPGSCRYRSFWAIDMTVLDFGGRHYAVWSGWDRYCDGENLDGQYLYIAEMTFHDEKPYVRLGRSVLLSMPELPWEINDNGEHAPLLEGPEALYNDRGDAFIIYSTRGSWTVDYKLGQLKLPRGGDPLDPSAWQKKPEPVFAGVKMSDGLGYEVYGAGHASFTTSPDGSENWIYYHTKTRPENGWGDRKCCLQKFSFDENGDPVFGTPWQQAVSAGRNADGSVKWERIPYPRPSGEVEREKAEGAQRPKETFTLPICYGADPWVTHVGDKYYTCWCAKGGIVVNESDYLTCFRRNELSRTKSGVTVWTAHADDPRSWNQTSVWAPEIHFIEGRWYIFYTAGKDSQSPYWRQRAGVLVSREGPFGPYEEHDTEPLHTGNN